LQVDWLENFVQYVNIKLNTLIIAGVILLVSLYYDSFRYRLLTAKEKYFLIRIKTYIWFQISENCQQKFFVIDD
jgi:hypothetical protein